jgi:hypothetical protein
MDRLRLERRCGWVDRRDSEQRELEVGVTSQAHKQVEQDDRELTETGKWGSARRWR